jgi:hypothetical protein
MMSGEFLLRLMQMPVIKDSFNFVLRYLLSQPSEVDIVVAACAFIEFTGISHWIFLPESNDAEQEDMLISLPQLEPISKRQEF